MRKFVQLLILVVAFFFFVVPVNAQTTKNVTIVNPIRGQDFWSYPYGILETPRGQYQSLTRLNLPATWLVRYDALTNSEVQTFLKGLSKNQEIGLFMEVTPTFTKEAGVTYHQSQSWHYPESVFLTGYSVEDRHKLIDTAFEKYKSLFGAYPQSVGAWWIDAGSLQYMRDKYQIEANMDVADQYSTDHYQIWGQYFSVPFYPSKNNALMPAQSPETKIGVVTIQWATRDPYNSYGNGAGESTYSVQPNDYVLHKLGIDYFKKLLAIYPQVTIGIENDFDWKVYGAEYTRQLEAIRGTQVTTMADYATFYAKQNPGISPNVLISADDPLGTSSKVVWYHTDKYRVGLFYGPYGVAIRDLRQFNDSAEESCLKVACSELNFSQTAQKVLDEVTFGTRWLLDEGKISNYKVTQKPNEVVVTYTNQAGVNRTIRLLPNDIEVDGRIQPVSFAILSAASTPENQNKLGQEGYLRGADFLKVLPAQLIGFFKFIVYSLLFFWLPGWVLTRRRMLALPVGWGLFTLLSFGLGYLHMEDPLWILPVVSLILWWKQGRPFPGRERIPVKATLLIILGSLTWLMTVVKSGLMYNFGLGFWGPNGHDGIWHLALISSLQRSFPPENPLFAGETLSNYHYFFDLLIARSGTLFGLDNADLLFRFFPILLAPLVGILVYQIVLRLTGRNSAALWATFFVYFGGSWGWAVNYFRNGTLGGESMFWSQQAVSTLLNPPYAISLVLFLTGFWLFMDWLEDKEWNLWSLLPLLLTWGIVVEFKAYAGVLIIGALGLLALEQLVTKRNPRALILMFSLGLTSAVVFLPNNSNSTSLLILSPLWLISSMIDFQDRVGWYRLSLTLHSGSLVKEIGALGLGTIIFLLGNMGTRIVAVFGLCKGPAFRFLLYFAALGLIFSLLFIQKGTNWNTVQFFYYTLFIISLMAGIGMSRIRLGKLGYVFAAVIILLTVVTTYDASASYLPGRPPTKISPAELQALTFLKSQEAGTVLSMPFDPYARNHFKEPVPMFTYDSTAYVAAYSNHPSFIEDTVNLDILGVDYKGRLNVQRDVFKDRQRVADLLKHNNISYLYVIKSVGFEENEGSMNIKKIFENDEVKIFKTL